MTIKHLARDDAALRSATTPLRVNNCAAEMRSPELGEKRCSDCGFIYPDTQEFFAQKSALADGTRPLYKRCRLCVNEGLRTLRRPDIHAPVPSKSRELHRILHLFSSPMPNEDTPSTAPAFVWSIDDESFNYASLQELIEDNRRRAKVGTVVYFGVPLHAVPSDFVHAQQVLEIAQREAHLSLGEVARNYGNSVSAQALYDLQELLESWLMRHVGLPNGYTVSDVCRYTITAHDLS